MRKFMLLIGAGLTLLSFSRLLGINPGFEVPTWPDIVFRALPARAEDEAVVFPDAPLKIFLTASAEERARRRYLQLKGKGEDVSLSSLLDEIRARDERDTQRAVAPLKPAADAIQLDSTELSIDQVLQRIMSEIAIRSAAADEGAFNRRAAVPEGADVAG